MAQGAAAIPGGTVTSGEEEGLFLSCMSYFYVPWAVSLSITGPGSEAPAAWTT